MAKHAEDESIPGEGRKKIKIGLLKHGFQVTAS
jgi:hypothetical protein